MNRQHRATWVATELMLTFPTPTIKAITILPLNSEETGGRFRVWLALPEQPATLIWDRKVEGGFPELKLLVSPLSPLEVLHVVIRLSPRNNEYGIISSLVNHWGIRTRSKKLNHSMNFLYAAMSRFNILRQRCTLSSCHFLNIRYLGQCIVTSADR